MMEISNVTFTKLKSRLDAEYYKPIYLEIESDIEKLKLNKKYEIISLKKITNKIRKGIFYILKIEYKESGVPFIRVGNIKNMLVKEKNMTYISEEKNMQEIKTFLKPRDIVISKGGTIGQVALIPSYMEKVNISQDVIGVSVNKNMASPEYIAAFFLSKYGSLTFERNRSQQTHQHLALEPVRELQIPLPTKDKQAEVEKLVNEGISKYKSAIDLHDKSIKSLLQQSGLENINFEKQTIFTINVSELTGFLGWGSEQHLPVFKKIRQAIKEYKYKYDRLGNLIQISNRKIDPTITPEKTYQYVELGDIEPSFGSIEGYSQFKGHEAPSRARRLIQKNDVLVPYLGGSFDKVAIVTDKFHDMICSTGFYVLRSKIFDSWYLFTLCRSGVFQHQFQQYVTGTIMPSVSRKEIKEIILPIPPKNDQKKIGDLMKKAFQLKIKGEELIGDAISLIERQIVQGILEVDAN